jgi:hypothetical protein
MTQLPDMRTKTPIILREILTICKYKEIWVDFEVENYLFHAFQTSIKEGKKSFYV